MLIFSNGVTSQTFSVPITSGSVTNKPKTVKLMLNKPAGGASLGTHSATLHILGE